MARDGTAEPVSGDQLSRRERGQQYINFNCSADHERDWQLYTVAIYFAIVSDSYNF